MFASILDSMWNASLRPLCVNLGVLCVLKSNAEECGGIHRGAEELGYGSAEVDFNISSISG
jgi:hypothetical protein